MTKVEKPEDKKFEERSSIKDNILEEVFEEARSKKSDATMVLKTEPGREPKREVVSSLLVRRMVEPVMS